MMEDGMMGMETTFRVRIEHVSSEDMSASPFAPGVWVLHSEAGPIFVTGEADRGKGLEALAEDGAATSLKESLAGMGAVAGIFNTPVGADAPGPLRPGNAYEFEFTATAETPYLSFVSMLVQSNDLFIGPNENGIALFGMDGHAIGGDVTAQVFLWDAGTEANEEPGVGENQAPRQSAPNTGPADEDTSVRLVNDMYSHPAVGELVKVTIEVVE